MTGESEGRVALLPVGGNSISAYGDAKAEDYRAPSLRTTGDRVARAGGSLSGASRDLRE